MSFVVCARLVGQAANAVIQGNCEFYLDEKGRWGPAVNARTFDARDEAEAVMQQLLERFRDRGNTSVELLVEQRSRST